MFETTAMMPRTWVGLLTSIVAGAAAIACAVAFLLPADLSAAAVLADPLPMAIICGLAGLLLAAIWLFQIGAGSTSHLVSRGLLTAFFALWLLGIFSLLMLAHFRSLSYPIAKFAVLPSPQMLGRLALWDALAGVILSCGILLGGLMRPKRWREGQRERRPTIAAGDWESRRLLRWSLSLLGVGALGTLVVVASTHRLALLSPDVNQVRFSQGSGIGFATLAQNELISAGIIGALLAIHVREMRFVGGTVALASAGLIVLTRAERTPILVMAFALLLLLRFLGKRPRTPLLFGAAIALMAGALFLGIVRFESQESGQVSSDAKEVHALLDVSPEVREQAFVYANFPAKTSFLGTKGILPVAVAPISGKLLELVGVDKAELTQDSSHLYTETMDKLGIYHTETPIRVGLPGELWMDGGVVALVIGMVLIGVIASLIDAWNPSLPLHAIAKSIASTLLLLSLITPLAIISSIAFTTIVPLLLSSRRRHRPDIAPRRDASSIPSIHRV